MEQTFGGRIDLSNLLNYANQPIPNYINKDNTGNNEITDAGATLGRVLFYDKNLSVDNTISCASCHKQEFAFGDGQLQSDGVAGVTGRHAMRLVNARFSTERRFFWDERANNLEAQTTQPIQNHVEMGFSGQNGDPGINDLIEKLEAIPYYQELFTFVYGDPQITEQRMQRAMAQFIRSIQSFDSKFDQGRAQVNNDNAPFPNYTAQENMGKNLFISPPNAGGAGCQGCHRAPEFDIDPNSQNNNVVGNLENPSTIDVTITRSPSLRNLTNSSGQLNGPLMHDGSLANLEAVIEHYNEINIVPGNNNLDNRLRGGGPGGPPGNGQRLNLTQQEKDALIAFLETLSGTEVYSDVRWGDPF
ncbi:MAG: cytochrome-c peroxidase [Saprospiraceae bacterium]|nr:cytochrome-c peroxidase [Saprospiraceae bacterium]